MNSLKFCFNIFKSLCVFATTFMVGYWIFKYKKNDDVTLIEYNSLDDIPEFIYPEMSICFLNPFLRNSSLNVTKEENYRLNYLAYLQGGYHFNKYKDINYDEVTVNLEYYFEQLNIIWKRGKNPTNYTSCENLKNCPYLIFRNNYNGFTQAVGFLKCFGVQIDKNVTKDVAFFNIKFNKNLKQVITQVMAVTVWFNYPNQVTRPRGGGQSIWNKNSSSKMEVFQITSVDLLKRRMKQREKCADQWNIFDELVLRNHIEFSGCRPPYISHFLEFPMCNSSKDIKNAHYDGWSLAKQYVDDPCQEMPTIDYKSFQIPIGQQIVSPKMYQIFLEYPTKGKTVTQLQEVDIHSLIGNIGGYIGLFLGNL